MYGTVAGADTYHLARGAAQWTGTVDAKLAALLRGSEWLDGAYGARFPGVPADPAQERAFPRTGATDRYGNAVAGTPLRVIYAAYEAALREIVAPFSLTPDFVAATAIKRKREKVDVLEEETEFANPTGKLADLMPVLATVEGLLAPLLYRTATFPTFVVV